MSVDTITLDKLMSRAKFRESFKVTPRGKSFKNLSTIVIIPNRGMYEEKTFLNCSKCKTKNEYIKTTSSWLHPAFVQAYYRQMIRPMNIPWTEVIPQNMEVGDAYSKVIEMIMQSPMKNWKYILTIEDDNIVPFIPNSQGPFMMLVDSMEKGGFDAVGGLYWTKGDPSMPLLYGDPKEKFDTSAGMFKVRFPAKRQNKKRRGKMNLNGSDWHEGEIVECNGMGMGFTLFKLELFKDERIAKPWFETKSDHAEEAPRQYTQDLNFFEKFRKLGYRCAVDTRVRVPHMDYRTMQPY